jgi:hypothetical protein
VVPNRPQSTPGGGGSFYIFPYFALPATDSNGFSSFDQNALQKHALADLFVRDENNTLQPPPGNFFALVGTGQQSNTCTITKGDIDGFGISNTCEECVDRFQPNAN